MTTRELLEMASLDALGLLDEQERDEFERAFRTAQPHVQAEVRREQVRCARLERLLPDVAPPPGIRGRVLGAVREAIAAVSAEASPLAQIGPARLGFSTVALWRAACIGFATASLVLASFFLVAVQTNKNIVAEIDSESILEQLQQQYSAPFLAAVANPATRHVSFDPVVDDFEGKAKFHIDPDQKIAFLTCKDLPLDEGVYTLFVKRGDGSSEELLRQFEATGGVAFILIPQAFDEQDDFEVRGPVVVGGAPTVVYRTADL